MGDSLASCRLNRLGGLMKYNLIPKERQKSLYALPQRGYIFLLLVLSVSCVLIVIVGMVLRSWAHAEEIRFMTQSLPIQQQVITANAVERKLKKRIDEIAIQEKNKIHWPAVLVMLAVTKPAELDIERLEVRQRRFIIFGNEEVSQGAVRKWQDKLQQESMVKQVIASQKKNIGTSRSSFQIEVELEREENALEKSTPST